MIKNGIIQSPVRLCYVLYIYGILEENYLPVKWFTVTS